MSNNERLFESFLSRTLTFLDAQRKFFFFYYEYYLYLIRISFLEYLIKNLVGIGLTVTVTAQRRRKVPRWELKRLSMISCYVRSRECSFYTAVFD